MFVFLIFCHGGDSGDGKKLSLLLNVINTKNNSSYFNIFQHIFFVHEQIIIHCCSM